MEQVKRSYVILAVVAVALALAVGGCNKPTAEMKRAEAALQEAKNAGATEVVPGDVSAIEKLIKEGKDLMNRLQYKKARAKFEEAYRLALEAKKKALAAKGGDTGPGGPGSVTVEGGLPTTHTVVKGECLWWIAEYQQIYNDPFQWPLIYSANQSEIDNTAHRHGFYSREEDWIFPDQQFSIPRDASLDEIKNARKRAGAPAPYTPPGQ